MDFIKELGLILVGGACAAGGGFLSAWYQSTKARKIRFEEILGERKVEVYQKALSLALQLQSVLIQGTIEDSLGFVNSNHSWVCDNAIFLPEKYEQNWKSVLLNLRSIKRLESGRGSDEQADKLTEMESFVDTLAKEMEQITRKELGLDEIKIQRLAKTDKI